MSNENTSHISEKDSIKQRLAGIFENNLGREAPAANTDLFNSGILDSLTFVEMLLAIEHEFDVALSLETIDFERFQTLDCIAEFIEDRKPESVSRLAGNA